MQAGLASHATGAASGAQEAAAASAAGPGTNAAATVRYSPSGRFVAPEPAELAARFPQLEILELLGQGGMGAVYKARQKQLNRFVALKILPSEAASDPTFAERFSREAQALARLNHPHIVTVHDFGQAPSPQRSPTPGEGVSDSPLSARGRGVGGEGALYYFVMEFVDGANLRRMLEAGHLSPREALAIVPQVCDALQYAHDEGVVHRDIKPENILLDKKGRVKIADFGLAKLLRLSPHPSSLEGEGSKVSDRSADDRLTGTHQVMGTLNYIAPEQMERPQTVDHRADIYSLGVVFYEMLTGELPLGRFAAPSQKVQVDVRLDDVVLRSLERNPERRYQQAHDVKTDVENISRTGGAPLPPVPKAVQAATAVVDLAEARAQVRGPAIGLLVTGIIHCVVFLTILIGGIVLTAGWWGFRTRTVPNNAGGSWQESRPSPDRTMISYRSEEQPSSRWIMKSEGPALDDGFGRVVLNLQPAQIGQVNSILQNTYRDYLRIEEENIEEQIDDSGHWVVTIKRFPVSIAKLEDHLWSQLDTVLNSEQQAIARNNLKLGPVELVPGVSLSDLVRPGFFGWGNEGARIEIWRVGTWHHWKVQTRGYEHSSQGAQLPEEYQRFWTVPPEKQPAPDVKAPEPDRGE